MPECTANSTRFRPLGRRRIDTSFEGGNITSDGGVLILREVDERLQLTKRLAAALNDSRRQASCDHSARDLIRQRIFSLVLGYEDLNDHDTLRDDILIQTATGRDRRLACRTTIGRFERRACEEDSDALHELLVTLFIEAHDEPPTELVLDFDATDDIVHGHQEGRAFNAYYDDYCFLPLYVFCGRHPLVASLRRGDAAPAEGVEKWLRWLTERLRAKWPDVHLILRGDAGFGTPEIYRCCESLGVDFIVGIGKNPKLLRLSEAWMTQAEAKAASAEDGKARVFGELQYRAGSWKRDRRIIVKAEHNAKGANPRYLVTSLNGDPRALYEKLYCARGEMENRIKEQQLDLFADRTSSTEWWTNQLRLLLSTFAYVLVENLRRRFLGGTELERAYVGTIRLRLLKIGGIVVRNTRRIVVKLSSVFPGRPLFEQVLKRMAAA